MTSPKPPHGAKVPPRGQRRSEEEPSPRSQRTWPKERARNERERAKKAARVRTLTDPLGAKGFRSPGKRIRAETSARRKMLYASVATFAASFGVIVATNQVSTTNADPATQPAAVDAGQATQASGAAFNTGEAVDGFGVQTNDSSASTLLFPASAATPTPSPTTAAVTASRHHDDDEEGDDHEHEDHEDGNSALLTGTTSNSSDMSVSQVTTSGQSSQSSTGQQPSHTRSGGS